ncbi:YbaB/EbfC family nucleoid-associated protein [Sphaerisporangium sp. TRM90804]|uniref:YbaB/EbfC family nucleoid-associated protein n=1 Tax=Sphaerisporangium sp. TRM90804 TaxID=3031113 RepID=UPI00244CCE19|nr:YbaB/EbfC family nucleoid-associated protein [Sphaerisporangium sp. TRM90804]MDH2427930.1 YbaB/EbfC family nucleoid-associated protein [Sphaerisporangium sp. TRM90804]
MSPSPGPWSDDLRGDDLDHLERVLRQTEEALRGLADAHARVRQVTGEGEGAGGMVKAVADGTGRLTAITLNPRVMRLDPAELGREATKAIQAAQEAAGRGAQEIVDGARAGVAALDEPLDETFVRRRIEQVEREIG